MDISSEKRGFLKENFKFFYIKDKCNYDFDYHFHDFYKIVIMISGNVKYLIEGSAYNLNPWDILFVSNDEVHKPLVDGDEYYERFILWISPEYLKSINTPQCDLGKCFKSNKNSNLLRLKKELPEIQSILYEIHRESKSNYYGKEQLMNSIIVKFLVLLNRYNLSYMSNTSDSCVQQNNDITNILKYINDNLISPINIDSIASHFFMSRYSLMHKFKEFTGFTISNYITQKRLIVASTLLRAGKKSSEVYLSSGFRDYSSFYRSFKKFFGISPKEYRHNYIK